MKSVIVEFGVDCRNCLMVYKEMEMKFDNERDLVKRGLLEGFNNEEECVGYWNEFCGCGSMEEVIDEVIDLRNKDLSIGRDFGYMSSEEGYFRVRDKF